MFELLVSGDAVVADHDAALAYCQYEWGLPAGRPDWTAAPLGVGAKWTFARIQHDRRQAPTALEILGIPYQPPGLDERPQGYPYLPEIAASQGSRPVRNHSTVVSTRDVYRVAQMLERTGGDFRLDEPDSVLPFPRLWIGFSPSDPGRYRPNTDGGLRLEVIPHEVLSMPEPEPDALADPLGPGAPVRIVARTLLVRDLSTTLNALNENFGWCPEQVTEGPDNELRSQFTFPYPRSARLEVVQPNPSGIEGVFLKRWGPGPYSIRIAVNGLDVLRRRFMSAQIPHQLLPPTTSGRPSLILRGPERLIGTAFEFVEND